MIRIRHFKMASRFIAHRFRGLHPFEVEASLLNACNLRCTYCSSPFLKTPEMTTNQWLAVIDQLADLERRAHLQLSHGA